MCDKIPYESQELARNAAKGMGRHGKGTMKAYLCRECNTWHLMTENKRSALRKNKSNKYPMRLPLPRKRK